MVLKSYQRQPRAPVANRGVSVGVRLKWGMGRHLTSRLHPPDWNNHFLPHEIILIHHAIIPMSLCHCTGRRNKYSKRLR